RRFDIRSLLVVAKHHRRALALRQGLQGFPYAITPLTVVERAGGGSAKVRRLGRDLSTLPSAPAQSVEAKVHGDPVHPRFELGLARLPCRGVFPDAEKNFLCDIFCFRRIAEHPASKSDHARQVPANELGGRPLVAGADTAHQFLVRIPHGLEANSAKRSARPAGQFIKAALLFTYMHPAATFAEGLLLFAEPAQHVAALSCIRSFKRRREALPSLGSPVRGSGARQPRPGPGTGSSRDVKNH